MTTEIYTERLPGKKGFTDFKFIGSSGWLPAENEKQSGKFNKESPIIYCFKQTWGKKNKQQQQNKPSANQPRLH